MRRVQVIAHSENEKEVKQFDGGYPGAAAAQSLTHA